MVLIHRLNVFLKPRFFYTCKKNILIYFQMRFQLYQSHCLTAAGLKIGKKSINWVSQHFRDLQVTLKLKLQTLNFAQTFFKSHGKICEKC